MCLPFELCVKWEEFWFMWEFIFWKENMKEEGKAAVLLCFLRRRWFTKPALYHSCWTGSVEPTRSWTGPAALIQFSWPSPPSLFAEAHLSSFMLLLLAVCTIYSWLFAPPVHPYLFGLAFIFIFFVLVYFHLTFLAYSFCKVITYILTQMIFFFPSCICLLYSLLNS
jgi:hypothetical protein